MGDIILKKTDPESLTYSIRNLGDISIELDMPTTVFSLPEEKDVSAIGMKIEGNTSTINIQWTLVDEATDTCTEVSNTATADEQMAFLLDRFQSSGIEHAYEFKLMPNSGSTPFYSRTGSISKIGVTKSGDSPVTYNASVTFLVADMVASQDVEEDNTST
jgi:hypothetical protein